MLKVFDSRVPSKIKIEIDYSLPFLLQCVGEQNNIPFFYWRTYNSKSSLMKMYISSKNKALYKIEIPLTGQIKCISNQAEIENIKKSTCIHGIPKFDTSKLKINEIIDEPGYFEVILNDDNLLIKLSEKISIAKVFCVDHLNFCIDINNNLILIAYLNIFSSFKISELPLVSSGDAFDVDNLTLLIDNQTNRSLYVKKEISNFLHEISNLGICESVVNSEYLDYLLSKKYYEADDFLTEVFYLSSISPETHLSLFKKVKEKFINRFGDL